ncbi:hypothetical protein ACNAN0_07530 [Agrilactobacillus fermenti]|uniref:hypothetical protein n=1 Tax=Agrilactobacillus fermenti TaxID=2586909 RepID=UPI003A5C40B6
MLTFAVAITSVIIIVALYYLIKRIRRNAALKILLNHSQKLTNKILAQTLMDPSTNYENILQIPKQIDSEPVQDIWGKGIMVFEYKFAIGPNFSGTADFFDDDFTNALAQKLNEHASENGVISSMPRYTPFVISDHWYLENYYHIDIAFMTNKPTIDYVKDMKKVTTEAL